MPESYTTYKYYIHYMFALASMSHLVCWEILSNDVRMTGNVQQLATEEEAAVIVAINWQQSLEGKDNMIDKSHHHKTTLNRS